MSGGRKLADSVGCRADLSGPGWGEWCGGWSTRRRLEGWRRDWKLIEDGKKTACWPSLSEAIESLWADRTVHDRAPWAVGWLGYGACAEFGGDLPARQESGDEPSGLLLLEPERTAHRTILSGGCASKNAFLQSSLSEEQFHAGVQSVRELIAQGSVYQVNLCRRFTVDPWQGGLASLFDAASVGGASPEYLSAFSWDGESPGELVCASMELLVSRQADRLETRPIKGTRPRGSTPESDLRLSTQLHADPKERAELAMIVDLERNDLGRVARTGSVVVENAGEVRSWERIHHRVARVCAKVSFETPWTEIVAVMAPGGSVTGCPKRSAMSVISDLEPVSRGPFTGALGVISGNGDLELALPIRTAWTTSGRLEMAAGCGIVWESDPVSEEAESRLKIQNWLDMVGR